LSCTVVNAPIETFLPMVALGEMLADSITAFSFS
jgi:hypothetical protein